MEAHELIKVYKNGVKALKGISMRIKEGKLFTLVGPNGAGKTTLIRISATQLMPTEGTVKIMGYDVVDDAKEVRKIIAIVPQDVATYGMMTPWDYSYYFARLRGMSISDAKQSAKRALKMVGMWDLKDRLCSTLSGGEKKRAIIASCLASDASLLMLDEPTSGVDPIARRSIWSSLRDMVKEGKTLLLTTHIMEEAEMLSDEVAVINDGKLIATGTVDSLRKKVGASYRVIVEGDGKIPEEFGDLVRVGDRVVIYVNDESEALEVLKQAVRSGLRASVSQLTFEDVFIKLMGDYYEDR